MTVDIASLVSDNLDAWTTAVERKTTAGRGGGGRAQLYGIDRLRPLIVDLAVRGKLTTQESGDEPAAAALARLAEARRRKTELGLARKPKTLSPLPVDLPVLPVGWAWTQLGTIAEISPSNSAEEQLDVSFVPMALISTRIDGAHEAEFRKWVEIKKGFTHFAEGDIGLAKITPCFENGKAAIFENLTNGIGAGTTELHVARPWSDDVNRRYLLLTMKTASYLRGGVAGMTGTAGQKRVTRTYFESSPLPLPPLAEQQRIVAKVDELMALCDALERESTYAMAAHQALVETVLATLINSADNADLTGNWARLESHFHTLFTTEASIDALKQTILDLAVRGKLVEQDRGDEPAGTLLKRLKTEKSRLSRIGRSGSMRGSQPISKEQQIYSVPESWIWVQLGELTETITSGSRDWSKYLSREGAKFVTMGNLSRDGYELRLEKMHYVKIGNDREGTRTSLRAGDLLVSITGEVGNMALIPEAFGEAYINQHTAMVRFLPTIRGRYLPEALRSPVAQRQFNEPQRGVKNSFRLSDIQNISLPLPPLAEQHRIVAKIDELMMLCDTLKARLIDAGATQRQLADAIVERAAA